MIIKKKYYYFNAVINLHHIINFFINNISFILNNKI